MILLVREECEVDAPSEAADERDELVEVRSAEVRERGTKDDDDKPEGILLPLNEHALLPAALEDAVLHNTHRREELQRHGEQDRERVQELDL